MKKRVLSLLLAVLMLLSLFPASALAEEAALTDEPVGDGVLDVPFEDYEESTLDPVILSEESEANEAEGSFPEGQDPSPEAQNDMGANVPVVGDGVLDVPFEDYEESTLDPVILSGESEANEAEGSFPEGQDPSPEAQDDSDETSLEESAAPTAETESDPAALASSGTCGDDLTWTLDDEGTLTISGTGLMDDWDSLRNVYAPWFGQTDRITKIVVNSGVTSIGDRAFFNCSRLTDLMIPSSVTSVGELAFSGCSSLTSVVIPSSMRNIGYVPFYGCNNLKTAGPIGGGYDIEFGWTTIIPSNAFSGCSELMSVTIPEGVTSIGNVAFYGCSSLTSVTIPDSVTSIGSSAFSDCSKLKTAGPIGSGCNIEFGWTMAIPHNAFSGCSKLTSVTIPVSVTGIEYSAFFGCSSLNEIHFLGSAPTIGEQAFSGVTATAYYPANDSTWTDEVKQGYGGNITWVAEEAAPEIIASGTCGDDLTWTLDDQGTLTISGTGEMTNYGFGTTPWNDFLGSIQTVRIESGVTSIGDYAFSHCESLLGVTMPDGLRLIGDHAFFDCSKLMNVTIPDSVTTIGQSAFTYCRNFTSVSIPSSVTSIGAFAFSACGQLSSFNVDSGNQAYCALDGVLFSKDVSTLICCPTAKAGNYAIPTSVSTIASGAFSDCGGLTSVTIPSSVISIYVNAFINCSSLTTIRVAAENESFCDVDGVLFSKDQTTLICCPGGKIGDYTIPAGLQTLDALAFQGCRNLTSVTIPASVTEIGSYVFDSCRILSGIHFLGSAPTIGTMAFAYATATAYYPANDATWTDAVKQNYGGNITWVAYQPEPLSVAPSELALPAGKTATLSASGTDAELVWTSSNETVATVDQNGVVTAKKYGKATITVTVPGTDLSASCEVQTLFWDVADSSQYYFRHVYWAAEAGITKGYDLEYFGPQLECTREQMMTFLWRMAGKPNPKTTRNPFPDVPSNAYYYKAVLWGVENGITNGFSSGEYAGKFGVGLPCTREQAMTFMWRMAGKPEPKAGANPFKDIKPGDYYYKAVLWASQNGIANGYTSGEYAGKYGVGLACLREHMVTFLSRYNSKFN